MVTLDLNSKKKVVLYHVLVWSVFILYELGTLIATVGLKGHYAAYAIYYSLYAGLFYFHAHVILDFSFLKANRGYLIAALLIVTEIMFFGLIKAVADSLLGGKSLLKLYTMLTRAYILTNLFRQIFFIGFSTAYWSTLYFRRFHDRARQMEVEQLRQQARTLELQNQYFAVENAYLQNQVSPHLLFNSLNFIYYAVYRLSERAGKGILLLSDLLRYSLTVGGNKQLADLSEEIQQVEQLIELDRMRFKEKRYLIFKKEGHVSDQKIVPLALLTLVENMIKHGECGDPDWPATVSLVTDANKLSIKTVNKKRKNNPFHTTGIGLQNLNKRLRNTYNDHFTMEQWEYDERFFVELTIYL